MSWIIFGYDSDGREISKLSAKSQAEAAARLFAEAVSAKYGWATLSYETAEIDPKFNRPKLVTTLFVKGTAQ